MQQKGATSMNGSSIRFARGKHEGTSDIEEYSKVLQKYMPANGEGDTMASQTATAVNMIVYRFLNDGDTIWSDSLHNEADWLYENAGYEVSDMIDNINEYVFAGSPTLDEYDENTYTGWIGELLDFVCYDGLLESLADEPATGSIYNCSGPVTEAYRSMSFLEDLEEELDYICPGYGYTLEDADISRDETTFNITGDAFDVVVSVFPSEDSRTCTVKISRGPGFGRLAQFNHNAVPDQCAEAIMDGLADLG